MVWSSAVSRDLIQSFAYTLVYSVLIGWMATYHFINIPGTMLTALLGISHALMDPEMPIHMSRLFGLALLVRLETSATLRARDTQAFI